MKRLESIQIMRGIAATMVMVHHFTYAKAAPSDFHWALQILLARRMDVLCDLGLRHSLCNVFNELPD